MCATANDAGRVQGMLWLAESLQEKLAGNPMGSPLGCSGPARPGNLTCLTAEGQRPTQDDLKNGAVDRPFHKFNPARMCGQCNAYWFASRAVHTLRGVAAGVGGGAPPSPSLDPAADADGDVG